MLAFATLSFTSSQSVLKNSFSYSFDRCLHNGSNGQNQTATVQLESNRCNDDSMENVSAWNIPYEFLARTVNLCDWYRTHEATEQSVERAFVYGKSELSCILRTVPIRWVLRFVVELALCYFLTESFGSLTFAFEMFERCALKGKKIYWNTFTYQKRQRRTASMNHANLIVLFLFDKCRYGGTLSVHNWYQNLLLWIEDSCTFCCRLILFLFLSLSLSFSVSIALSITLSSLVFVCEWYVRLITRILLTIAYHCAFCERVPIENELHSYHVYVWIDIINALYAIFNLWEI